MSQLPIILLYADPAKVKAALHFAFATAWFGSLAAGTLILLLNIIITEGKKAET